MGKGTGTSGTTGGAPGPAGSLGLSLVQGRALLKLGQRDLGPALLQAVEVEFPGLKSLPNGGGAAGVRRRRGRLRTASLLVDNASLARRVAEAPDARTGITQLGIALEKGRIVLSGHVATSERSADFKARVTLAAGTGRSVRIGIDDLRVEGAPPLPLSAIANAALCALRGEPVDLSSHDGSEPGHAAFELDILELALDEVFVAEGFRLPDTAGARLGGVAVTPKGVELVWSDGAIPVAKPPAEPAPPKDEVGELRKALGSARREQRADLAQQLAAACERAGDETGAVEALKICIEHAPAGALVGPAWRRLVELHARGGDPHAAARALIASADDPRTGATDSERAATLVAAAEILRKRLNLRDDASMMLERAVALDPGSAEALEGLEAVCTEAGDQQRLADVLERKVEIVARGPVEQKEILTRLADLYDGPLGRPDRARASHERALRIDPEFPHSRVWLARDAWVRGDATGALAFVRPVPLAALPDEGLVLRADLGERERSLEDALPALEELRARALAAGQAFAAQELEARIIVLTHPEGVAQLSAGPSKGPEPPAVGSGGQSPPAPDALGASTTEELERRLSSDPADEAAVAELEGRYIAIGDPAHRAEALSGLLRRALGLSAERRKSIYAALGESAEAGGDLEGAEQAYWRAASIEAEPTLRANHLVAHARMLMARGDVQTAFSELDAALARAPNHAGATALLADLCYRTHDWTRARALYTALESAPDAADVIPRELLVYRRAALAHGQGDAAEAEALYRELAILNPSQAEARRALAELSRARGDLPAASQRLEEVLRLAPDEGTSDRLETRYRLASIYSEMGEWDSARYHLELVVSQDASRVGPLELLLEAYDRLNIPGAAAEACARLARLHREPTQRAAALYRQAELLRTRLDDPAGALDAYLRSSDLDPTFVPARLRLVDHYWQIGDLEVVADLANDLAGLLLSPDEDADLVARLAIASAHPRAGGPSRFPFSEHPALASAAVRALVDVAALSEGRGVEALDPFITRARAWAGPAGQTILIRMLVDQVVEDPARPAPALALGRFAELAGRLPLAGSAYGLLAFVAPHSPAARHLDTMGPLAAVRPDAVRIGSTIDHPEFAGPARRALARLASPLLGFGAEAPAPKPTEGSGLPPSRAAELRRIGDLIGAPPFIVVRDEAAMGETDDRRRLRVIPTHPAGLMIGSTATALGERAWSFVAGRALETLRSGLRTAGLAGGEGLTRLLEGARSALARTPIDEPQAKAIADWLRTPEAELSLGPDEARATTLVEIESALAALPDWTTFARGAQHTRNRIGLLACGRPNEALAILKAEDRDEPYASSRDGRSAFLNRPAARALVRFMFSPEYEEAFETNAGKSG